MHSVSYASPDLDLSGYVFSNENAQEAQRDAQGFLSVFFRDRTDFELVFHDEDDKRRRVDVWHKPTVTTPQERQEVTL